MKNYGSNTSDKYPFVTPPNISTILHTDNSFTQATPQDVKTTRVVNSKKETIEERLNKSEE